MIIKSILHFIVLLAVILLCQSITAQEWGRMQRIYWQNPPPHEPPGLYNPSYCDIDSLLYFDDCYRYDYPYYKKIFSSKFEGFDEYGGRIWSDPELLPYPINMPDNPEIANGMVCISTNGDTMFFCSSRPGTYGGMDIWLSVKIDSCWAEPVNLGDSINTEWDELKPYYAANMNILFFDRRYESIYFHIYKSSYLGGNVWQTPELLPSIINDPLSACAPCFDEFNNILYFTKSDDICKSYYNNGTWSEPEVLGDNVNGLYTPNVNNWVSTDGAFLSSDRQLLFYCKEVWEYSCIDFTGYLFYSEATIGIEEQQIDKKSSLKLRIYPNPSNSTVSFSFNLMFDAYVRVRVYNILGQCIDRLCSERLSSGKHSFIWNTSTHSSGVYFVKVNTGKEIYFSKFTILK